VASTPAAIHATVARGRRRRREGNVAKQRAVTKAELVVRAGMAIGATQAELGEIAHVSKRTIARWVAGATAPVDFQLARIARATHARDPKLAEEIAAFIGQTLEGIGIAPPRAAAPPPPPPFVPPPARLVDAVVCAAADAVGLTPAQVRPALLAAFSCADELRLTHKQVEGALAPPPRSEAKNAKTVPT
jgi:hypothetical protein